MTTKKIILGKKLKSSEKFFKNPEKNILKKIRGKGFTRGKSGFYCNKHIIIINDM